MTEETKAATREPGFYWVRYSWLDQVWAEYPGGWMVAELNDEGEWYLCGNGYRVPETAFEFISPNRIAPPLAADRKTMTEETKVEAPHERDRERLADAAPAMLAALRAAYAEFGRDFGGPVIDAMRQAIADATDVDPDDLIAEVEAQRCAD